MHQVDLDAIRAYYAHDRFDTELLGARVDSFEREPYRSVVSMDVDFERHANAQGFVMGGAFMALCDFALAVCSNTEQGPACSVSHTMECINRCKGKRLIATCTCLKKGRRLSFYEIVLNDELGTLVGRMSATTMQTPGVPLACPVPWADAE